MNQHIYRAVILGLALPVLGAHAKEKAPELKTPMDKVSYGVGVDIMHNFKKQGVDINLDLLVKGLKDSAAGGALLIPEKDLRPLMRQFQGDMRKKMVMNQRTAAVDNKRKADAFLEENKKKEGIQVLPNGVQYKVIKMGAAEQAKDGDTVEVHYRGNLIDGTEFDATETGKTALLKVASLINGWKEALKLMPVGSHWQLFIPPEQGYGERGVGSDIGPNELLIFDVELVGVKKDESAPAPTAQPATQAPAAAPAPTEAPKP